MAVTAGDYQAAALAYTDAAEAAQPIRRGRCLVTLDGEQWLTAVLAVDRHDSQAIDSTEQQALLRFPRRGGSPVMTSSLRLSLLYVAIELAISICAKPGVAWGDVEQALLLALSNTALPGGGVGFFSPDNFTFGAALYVSQLYAAVLAVPGVNSATITRLARLQALDPDGQTAANLQQGFLSVGADQIIRLDNDRNFPENGTLSFQPKRSEREPMSTTLPAVLQPSASCCDPPAAVAAVAAADHQPAGRDGPPVSDRHVHQLPRRDARQPPPRDRRRHNRDQPVRELARRDCGRLPDDLHRALGVPRRHLDLVPGADRQRGVPAHRHRSRFAVAARRPDRLPALSPPGAGLALEAFTVDKGKSLTIAASASRTGSKPAPGAPAVVFETAATITALGDYSAIPLTSVTPSAAQRPSVLPARGASRRRRHPATTSSFKGPARA